MPFTNVHILDPLSDKRWDELVASHPKASVFHQSGWLRALASTYGYTTLVVTGSDAESPLSSGIPFCVVKSLIAGHRLVSLPFSDHCDPLFGDSFGEIELARWLREEFTQQNWKYLEMRPLTWNYRGSCPVYAGATYWFHTLDLKNSIEKIFRGFHRDSIQRRIQHAEREQVVYEVGCSEELLTKFYRLQVLTRRRHRLLPQPRVWFRNLMIAMGDTLRFHVASRRGVPIAAILTLRHRNTVVYKYGCSDAEYHNLGAMPLLFWRLIEQCKTQGVEQINFGRTDMGNEGLRVFKERFGATRHQLTYQRCPEPKRPSRSMPGNWPMLRSLMSFIPSSLSPWLGKLAYRHLG